MYFVNLFWHGSLVLTMNESFLQFFPLSKGIFQNFKAWRLSEKCYELKPKDQSLVGNNFPWFVTQKKESRISFLDISRAFPGDCFSLSDSEPSKNMKGLYRSLSALGVHTIWPSSLLMQGGSAEDSHAWLVTSQNFPSVEIWAPKNPPQTELEAEIWHPNGRFR